MDKCVRSLLHAMRSHESPHLQLMACNMRNNRVPNLQLCKTSEHLRPLPRSAPLAAYPSVRCCRDTASSAPHRYYGCCKLASRAASSQCTALRPLTCSMSTNEYAKFQKVAVTAAQAAGQLIEQSFTKDKSIEFKGKLDLVTATDKACELAIFEAIRESFPDHKFIGEEGSAAQGFTNDLTDAPTWMVDPLDGTTNFVHRYPFVCTSIALVIKKEVVIGVVFNPIMKELFTAIKGQGAFLNGQPIKVSSKTQLDQALLATEIGVSRDEEVMDAIFDRIRNLTAKMRSIRCSGACALNLCSVACGRIDAMFEVGFGGCWDCAAGALMVTEAGGIMLDPSGSPFDLMARRVLGANAHLGKPVAGIIASCKSSNKEPQPLKQ